MPFASIDGFLTRRFTCCFRGLRAAGQPVLRSVPMEVRSPHDDQRVRLIAHRGILLLAVELVVEEPHRVNPCPLLSLVQRIP